MSRDELNSLLIEIRQLREESLALCADLTEVDFSRPTDMYRWDDARRVLLRFGDHMREHASQIEGIRAALMRSPTPPERMLAEAEVAWGKLLAATVNLTDADLDQIPPEGGWSIRQTLAHLAQGERNYQEAIRTAKQSGQPTG
ncbi:MAG: DinB family protein [Caldilineaceae bacterium]|nr:DinB family protein [Caldilineaceae bacterium]